MPAGVTAAVAQTGDVTDEDLIRAELVPVRTMRWWAGDPLPGHRDAD